MMSINQKDISQSFKKLLFQQPLNSQICGGKKRLLQHHILDSLGIWDIGSELLGTNTEFIKEADVGCIHIY